MPNTDIGTDKANAGDDKSNKLKNTLQRLYNCFCKDKANVWMAIFTGVLTVFTFKMWQVADITHESAKRSQMAYVFPHNIQQGVKIAEDGKLIAVEAQITWDNTGQTPVRTALSKSNWQRMDGKLPKDFSFPDLSNTSTKEIPLAAHGRSTDLLYIAINDLIAVIQKRSRIVIYGDGLSIATYLTTLA